MTLETNHESEGVRAKKRSYYLREVQHELLNVTWTTKEELIQLTKIVVGGTFALGLAVYLADLMIRVTLGMITMIARWVIG